MIQSNTSGIPAYMNVMPAGNGGDGFGMGGYSGHSINDRMIASLEHMMSQTNDKYEQEQIRNEIESIRRR